MTIQYGENEVCHLMALKEVNTKQLPEMTQEEVFSLEDLDDVFVLAQAEKKASVEDLIKDLDTSQTHVQWCPGNLFFSGRVFGFP